MDKDGIKTHLEANWDFARQQGLTDTEIAELPAAYAAMVDVLDNPEKYDDPALKVRELEFDLQKRWHFPEDAKFHKYQLFIKGCKCPVMDNWELIGYTEERYSTSDCPWHWKERK